MSNFHLVGAFRICTSYPCFLRLIFQDDLGKYYIQVEHPPLIQFVEVKLEDCDESSHYILFKDKILIKDTNTSLYGFAYNSSEFTFGSCEMLVKELKEYSKTSSDEFKKYIKPFLKHARKRILKNAICKKS